MVYLSKFLSTVLTQNWVILDTETTGLKNAEIVEIAIINSRGEPLLNTLVCPTKPIPPNVTAINGITQEQIDNASPWRVVGESVEQLILNRDVFVYNATFDRHMLYSTDVHNLITRARWIELARWHCVKEMFAEYNGEWNPHHRDFTWKSLAFAAQHVGYAKPQSHRALDDCLMTLAVVNFLAKVEIQE